MALQQGLKVVGIAVQGRYKFLRCPGVSVASLPGFAERPLPCNYNVLKFVFHGGNTGSNPVGDANSIVYWGIVYSPFNKRIGNRGFPAVDRLIRSRELSLARVRPKARAK